MDLLVRSLLWTLIAGYLGFLQNATRLDRALADSNIPSRGLAADLLSLPINGYLADSDPREAVVAFFDGNMRLHAARLERSSGRWAHRIVEVKDAIGAGNSVVGLKRTAGFIHIDSHINPSAGRLIVLTHDLQLVNALYGWEIATLPDQSVVYHHSQIHFAPTHSLEISVFNPVLMKEKKLYPPEPAQPVRARFMTRVADEYRKRGEDWFRDHNHHMNAELFDSSLFSEVVVDAAAKALSFDVRFGNPDNYQDPLPFSEKVRVTCSPIDSFAALRCSEETAR
jgi:hypothetical protein